MSVQYMRCIPRKRCVVYKVGRLRKTELFLQPRYENINWENVMNCYKHSDICSVGICRNCFKGVCSNCALEFEDGIACSDKCLEKAKATVQVVANSVLAQRGAKKGRFIGPSVISLLGLIFLAWASYCDELFKFTGALGALFLVLGIVIFLYNRKYFKPILDE